MTTQKLGELVRHKVGTHLNRLKKNNLAQNKQWDSEKKELLKQCLLSVGRFAEMITTAQNMLAPLFADTDVKDEFFRFFIGRRYRIGKYLLLPIFSSTEENQFNSAKGKILAFAWDICKAEPCLRIIRNTSDGAGEGEAVSFNFFSQNKIKSITEDFLNSDRSYKEKMLAIIENCNGAHAMFIEVLNRSGILNSVDAFLDRVVSLYSDQLTKKEVKKITFSERCKETVDFRKGDFFNCTASIMGDNKFAHENTEKANEVLLDHGYPDNQKIIVDMEDYFEDEYAKPKYRVKTVGFVREQWKLWNKNENLFSDEINNYTHYFGGHD